MRLRIRYNLSLDRVVARALQTVERLELLGQRIRPIAQSEGAGRWSRLLAYRRKLATLALAMLALVLAYRVLFGVNGTVIYGKKRSEYRALQVEVERLEKENQALAEQNKALKSDPEAIEREAREQLRYAKPGEVIIVLPGGSAAPPPEASAEKR